VYLRSVESLSVGLGRCSALGIRMLVTHIGSHLGSGSEKGIRRVVGALNGVLDGDETGIDGVRRPEQVGVCLDTCHAFAAGFDLRTPEGLGGMLGSMDETLGPGRLRLVHLNDSVGGLGSGIDHHEHIGLGGIGLVGFRLIMRSRLADLPMIMETPLDDRRDNAENMRIARELAST